MTDGNDWGDQPGGDWNQPEAPQANPQPGAAAVTTTQSHHPLANQEFDFGAFIEVVKLVFERVKDGPILKVILGITGLWLAWELLGGGMLSIAHFVPGASGILSILILIATILLYPIYLLCTSVVYALYKPAAKQVLEGPSPLGSPMELLQSTTGDILKSFISMLMLTVSVLVGTACCVLPGIAAGLAFCQAPYLVIVRDMNFIDAFKESFERGKRHWNVIALMFIFSIAVTFACFMIIMPMQFIVGLVSGFTFAPLGYMVSPVLSWVLSAVLLVVAFVLNLAACTTIDELEGLETIAR